MREYSLEHSHKEFTGALGKDMCIKGYLILHQNNFFSSKQYKKPSFRWINKKQRQ